MSTVTVAATARATAAIINCFIEDRLPPFIQVGPFRDDSYYSSHSSGLSCFRLGIADYIPLVLLFSVLMVSMRCLRARPGRSNRPILLTQLRYRTTNVRDADALCPFQVS